MGCSWELYVERKMIVRRRLVVYVLFVAGIFDGDGVAADGVGVVPLTRVCHVMKKMEKKRGKVDNATDIY